MNEELDYSLRVLEDAPARAAKLLQGIGAVPMIRTKLAAVGMTEADIDEGCTLLLACIRTRRAVAPDLDTVDAKQHRAAVVELDAWDEPGFARFGATLRRHFPSAYEFVFEGLQSAHGIDAVTGVATFLARIEALESGGDPTRAAKKDEDAKAIALLEKRGLTKDERARLEGLVRTALGPTAPLPVMPTGEIDAERLAKLDALRHWYDEWSSTARAVVKKRADLIRLGLASRRTTHEDDVAPAPTATEPPKGNVAAPAHL